MVWLTWFASHLDEAGRPSRGLYLNLQLRDLLLELSHGGDVVGFPQPNRHHLFFTLQRGGVMGGTGGGGRDVSELPLGAAAFF